MSHILTFSMVHVRNWSYAAQCDSCIKVMINNCRRGKMFKLLLKGKQNTENSISSIPEHWYLHFSLRVLCISNTCFATKSLSPTDSAC